MLDLIGAATGTSVSASSPHAPTADSEVPTSDLPIQSSSTPSPSLRAPSIYDAFPPSDNPRTNQNTYRHISISNHFFNNFFKSIVRAINNLYRLKLIPSLTSNVSFRLKQRNSKRHEFWFKIIATVNLVVRTSPLEKFYLLRTSRKWLMVNVAYEEELTNPALKEILESVGEHGPSVHSKNYSSIIDGLPMRVECLNAYMTLKILVFSKGGYSPYVWKQKSSDACII
ncbi:hypothetical protein M9H77_35935 [Catharanthus roseus]|uniref:Uncharacterized protein n=1 Tax=Catharanthus roseus TaxID=4058 RepID=A0ACB9ZU37_CATRO|nr:hypothetical protein M9H77_35935 [Catharanthus roseus]